MKRLMSTFILSTLLVVVASSCNQTSLAKVSKDLNQTTQAMHVLQQTVINANKQIPPVISTDTAVKLMVICLKIDQATEQSIQLTRTLNELDSATSANLLAILQPVLLQVNTALSDIGLLQIKDTNTRTTIQITLTALQTSLTEIQLLIQAGK